MELYPVLKLLHLASAIVRVGGDLTMVLCGLAASRHAAPATRPT